MHNLNWTLFIWVEGVDLLLTMLINHLKYSIKPFTVIWFEESKLYLNIINTNI